MKSNKHKFKDNDIVTDIEFNETFKFDDATDGARATHYPDKLRLATEAERKKLEGSGKGCIETSEKNSFILMPEHINIHNGSHQRCDMLIGACSCGAWHHIEDWKDKIENAEQYIFTVEHK